MNIYNAIIINPCLEDDFLYGIFAGEEKSLLMRDAVGDWRSWPPDTPG